MKHIISCKKGGIASPPTVLTPLVVALFVHSKEHTKVALQLEIDNSDIGALIITKNLKFM